jgi:signal transduction histidine kinase
LSVAKEFVEANGGTIQVQSTEGQGTEIRFSVLKDA